MRERRRTGVSLALPAPTWQAALAWCRGLTARSVADARNERELLRMTNRIDSEVDIEIGPIQVMRLRPL